MRIRSNIRIYLTNEDNGYKIFTYRIFKFENSFLKLLHNQFHLFKNFTFPFQIFSNEESLSILHNFLYNRNIFLQNFKETYFNLNYFINVINMNS